MASIAWRQISPCNRFSLASSSLYRRDARNFPVHFQPRIHRPPEIFPERRLQVGRKQVEPEAGGADGVCFFNDQIPARVEP